jgi:hypothetical protein
LRCREPGGKGKDKRAEPTTVGDGAAVVSVGAPIRDNGLVREVPLKA